MKSVKSLRFIMLIFIILPMLIVSIVGLTLISSFSAEHTAKLNKNTATAQIARISDTIGVFTAFLDNAAEMPYIKGAAGENPASRSEANNFLATYVDNMTGVYDILITNANGLIFSSYTGNYEPATAFRDDIDTLQRLATSPAPVSGFYDGGRFYCVSAIRGGDDAIIGYIILKSEAELIGDLLILEDSDIEITVSDDPNVDFTNEIAGTRWRWTYSYPPPIWGFAVWFAAFAASAVVCGINTVIMLVFTKRRDF